MFRMHRGPIRIAAILLLLVCVGTIGADAEEFSVVHLNMWSGLGSGGFFSVPSYEEPAARDFRIGILRDELARLSPDMVSLVEANPLPQTAQSFSEFLQYQSEHQVSQAGVRIGVVGLPANLRLGHLHMAASELDFARVGHRNLSGGGAGNLFSWNVSETSIVFGTAVRIEGTQVYLFSLHLHESPHAYAGQLVGLVEDYAQGRIDADSYLQAVNESVRGRERRLQEIRRAIVFVNEMAQQSPVILTGTLAALPDSDVLEALRDAGFSDVWQVVNSDDSGFTRDETINTNISEHQTDPLGERATERSRVDYILYRGDQLRPLSAELVFDNPVYGEFPSDHFGITARFSIEVTE